MTEHLYEAIVVGAGIVGCNTAYQLLKHGCKRVLLIEKFHLPHTRGSSGGHSRCLHNCFTCTEYAEMMPEVNRLWNQIEDEANSELLLRNTGEIDTNVAETAITSMTKYGLPWKILDYTELKDKLPHVNVPDNAVAILDPKAAIFKAGKCLAALQDLIKKLGGTIVDGEEVTNIKPGDEVEITTPMGRYGCKRLILTLGPWVNDLLSKIGLTLPVQIERNYHLYWKEKVKGTYSVKENFPVYTQTFELPGGYSKTYSLMPSAEYPGMVKVVWYPLAPGKDCHPDDRDADLRTELTLYVKEAKEWIRKHIPGIEESPSIAEPCLITMSPDSKFILDLHPEHKNIIIGAAASGEGFAMSPVVGKLLCQLALGHKPSYNLKPFSITRFETKSKI